MARAFRAYMVARSRFAEDQLGAAIGRGVDQYVLLGAGLDTFAYRNPFAQLKVFEVDFPATQAWKRALVAEAGIPLPATVRYVPLDFEHKTLADGLREGGLDFQRPAFFGWYAECVSARSARPTRWPSCRGSGRSPRPRRRGASRARR